MAHKEIMTQEGFEQLKAKLEQLKKDQQENIIALQDARAQGDLSENADYDAARNNQAIIAAQIKETENSIKNAEIIQVGDDTNLGKNVTVKFLSDGFTATYKIAGRSEADPLQGKISDESPLGKAICHAKKGDKVMIKTEDGDRFDVEVMEIFSDEEAPVEKKSRAKKK